MHILSKDENPINWIIPGFNINIAASQPGNEWVQLVYIVSCDVVEIYETRVVQDREA